MRGYLQKTFILALALMCTSCPSGPDVVSGNAVGVQIRLDINTRGAEIADTFYGLFFEDINYSADGGIYPELVRNRSFEWKTPDPEPKLRTLIGWTVNYDKAGEGSVKGAAASPLSPANPTYVTVSVTNAPYAIANRGFAAVPDMALNPGEDYRFYFYARDKDYSGNIVCALENGDGQMISNEISVTLNSGEWKKYGPFTFSSPSGGKALLVLRCEGTGTFDMDFVSLMPANTWGKTSQWPHGGLRADIVEALKAVQPGFIRFPGGCIVEGAYRHETAYQWKDTIGAPEERRENSNLWGYMMSYGLGFHEYFQLCEDIGAEPAPVLYAGILCQARRDRPTEADYSPGTPEFNALIQDYLDLIEYATGDAGTTWGAKRAANGHPAPFNLKKIGIGNENWGANYWRNFDAIRSAVLAAYPDVKVITTTGPLASGWINDEAWRKINERYKDAIVDEHYYMEPDWFLSNTRRYDSYLRNGVQIFVGEYAAHETSRANSWYAAICEASYMTGLERNADIVKMASYAPLLAREGMFQLAPDMIWFDGSGITNLTPSYHIQRLFSTNTGTVVLPPEKAPRPGDLFHASSLDEQTGAIYTKLVNPFPKAKRVVVSYANVDLETERASVVTISGEKNSRSVSISEDALSLNDSAITVLLGPYTAAVIQVRLKTGPK